LPENQLKILTKNWER